MEVQKRAETLLSKYPTSLELLKNYNPDLQTKIALRGHTAGSLALNRAIPTLTLVKQTYGLKTAEIWLESQLIVLSDNTEVKAKLNEEQMIKLSSLILAYFYHLNLAELAYFFGKLRSGAYGKFYGSITQDSITSALRAYEKERMTEISEIESKRQQEIMWKKRDQWAREAVSREEYLAMVARGEIKPINRYENNEYFKSF